MPGRRRQFELFDDEKRAHAAYRSQKSRAKLRGVPFEFAFRSWWAWWQSGGRWARRGRGADKLVMARLGDAGPYAPENVYVSTFSDNNRFARPQLRLDV
jgi:hypothetical protein